ncbi:MAG: tetratricopeptide repeat protein [Methylococcales bacterium]|nr:tetratricopeptide repeat protein [Methylococcales bacterium]
MKLTQCILSVFMVATLGNISPSFADVVSKPVYYQLKKVDELITKKSYTEAENIVQKALNQTKNTYEKAVLLRSLSSIYSVQKNYPKAIEFLTNALAIKSLPYEATQKAQLSLGQFYLANKEQDKAFQLLDAWYKHNPDPAPQTAILLANLYSQNKQYDKATTLVKKATSATENPPKSWTELQLALGYKTKDFQAAIVVLEKKLAKDPENKDQWQQLSAAYHNAGNYTKAAAIKHLAYQRGFLTTEDELLELAKLFLYANTPHKGAQFLEEWFLAKKVPENAKNLELLGAAWLSAKEPLAAKKYLESALALAPSASVYEKLAQIYAADKKWKKALESFNASLKLGVFSQQGRSQLLLGITQFHLKNMPEAGAAFELASIYKETAVAAQKWLNYMSDQ